VADTFTREAAEHRQAGQEDLGSPPACWCPTLIRVPMSRLLKRAAPRLKVLGHSEIPETHSIRIGPRPMTLAERIAARGERLEPRPEPRRGERIEPGLFTDGTAPAEPSADSSVARDVETLGMSTLTFQDYVRERMLKRREQAELAQPPATLQQRLAHRPRPPSPPPPRQPPPRRCAWCPGPSAAPSWPAPSAMPACATASRWCPARAASPRCCATKCAWVAARAATTCWALRRQRPTRWPTQPQRRAGWPARRTAIGARADRRALRHAGLHGAAAA
jgi:hypothetical protein